MNAHVTRDSVAAGDDIFAPHAATVRLPVSASVDEAIGILCRDMPLPRIAGGQATWVLSSGVPLAVLAEQWAEPRLLWNRPDDFGSLDLDGQTLRCHFSYLAQLPPEDATAVLERLTLRPL